MMGSPCISAAPARVLSLTSRLSRRYTTRTINPHTRSFSTSLSVEQPGPWSDRITKPLNRYVVIAEDYPGPSALARRLEVRERHLEQAAKGKEVGRIEMGGGLLKTDFKDIDEELGPTSALAGSLLIVQGESIEDVRSRLNQDEYVRAGVFDPSKIRIFPFLRSLTEQSVSVGNEAVGATKAVSTRKPSSESAVKSSNQRREVYVVDPKESGKALNADDRRSTESTLGHLRGTQGLQKKLVTLDTLRNTPLQVLEEESR
ncbi:hypothetical protein CBS101457_006152 [Exobasidium rhododendri]|nr:hypothetical protein CBS101457_006152 [Exobasidium rhododendri]